MLWLFVLAALAALIVFLALWLFSDVLLASIRMAFLALAFRIASAKLLSPKRRRW